DRGALVLFSAEDWRKSSQFNSLGQARTVWNFIESKLEGFSGVRITGDAQWAAIEPALSSDRLCHWEATADMLYRGEPVHTLCMYDSGKHAPSDLRAALRTHATVLTNGQFYANPHYEV